MLKLLRKHGAQSFVLGGPQRLAMFFKRQDVADQVFGKSTLNFSSYKNITRPMYRVNDHVLVGNTLFLCGTTLSGGAVAKTTDGENFSTVLTTPDMLTSIATNGAGVVVAGAYNGAVQYSLDSGATWARVSLPNSPGAGGISVRYGGGKFILVTGLKVYKSLDGFTWTLVYTASAGNGGVGVLSYANGKWFGGGEYNRYRYISNDGENWGTNGYWTYQTNGEVFWNGTKYFTATSTGNVYSSTNGSSWTYVANIAYYSPQTPYSCDMRYKDGIFVLGSNNGSILYSLDNGVTWTPASLYAASTDQNAIGYVLVT